MPEQVVRGVRQHVFFDTHQVPNANGVGFTMRRFDPDPEIARWWQAATEGGIQRAELPNVQRLFSHEYVEHALERSGVPYMSINHPDGIPIHPNSAHYMSPLIGDIAPGTRLPPDFDVWSHWDTIIRMSQGGK
jgi:hypothetical protein